MAAQKKVAVAAPVPFNGLTALDFSEFVTVDSPELAEFKAHVVRVARKYATAHNWCGVVDSALREMGAMPMNETVDVKVTTDIMEMVVKVKPEEFAGLTARRQATKIVGLIGAVSLMGAGAVRGSLTLRPESITGMEIKSKPRKSAIRGVPDDNEVHRFRYTSDSGRVAHAFLRSDVDEMGSIRVRGTADAICNTAVDLRHAVRRSHRGEDRLCDRCTARLGAT